jgi:hypothetical protein
MPESRPTSLLAIFRSHDGEFNTWIENCGFEMMEGPRHPDPVAQQCSNEQLCEILVSGLPRA